MNSFSIALKNIKKSRKDYAVYFLTLILGVAIFYMFNSIGGQEAMKSISRSTNDTISLLVTLIEVVSVAVAIVLGLLMVYANNFLIKRRKNEFGLYMLLGMGKKKVSKILVGETCIVGVISLGIGLFLGIFGSQFLSIIIGKMFELDLSGYRFTFSMSALIKTVINFAVMFLAVLIFNTATVSKYKLIDLLNADKKLEKIRIKNRVVSIVIFVLSVAALGYACVRVGFYGSKVTKDEFIACGFIGMISTFTFFWSLAGFIFDVIRKFKKNYSRGLNAFITRQFCKNVNSSSLSMALICLLLFVALVAFSTGFSFRNYINERLGKGATPVDVTVKSQDEKVTDILDRNGYKVDEWAEDYFEIPIYYGDQVTMGTLAGNYLDEAKQMFRLAKWGSPEGVMKVSDYNILERKFGREEVKLEGNQYVIISDFELLNQFSNKALADNNFVTISGIDYYPAESAAREEFMMLSGIGANLGVVIFPDEVICEENGFTAGAYLLAADYKVKDRADRLEVDDILEDKLGIEIDEDGDVVGSVYMTTKNAVVDTSTGTTVMVVFIVLYIGIVFIMACAAILALRILSDSIDSVKKYEILSRIGVTKHMQRRALFVQVLLNFLLPLLLATLHTYFGALYLKELFRALGFIKVSGGLLFTVIIMVVVYGGYFITTYVNCKHVINLD